MRKPDFHCKDMWTLSAALLMVFASILFLFIWDGCSISNLMSDESDIFSNYREEVVVFSLKESPLLQYASEQWNYSHTSKVICVTANDIRGEENWQDNQIKQEIENSILQGNGPDLLVLDGLGYLKSDLLITNTSSQFQDISYVFEQDNLYSNVTHLYTVKEKTYAIPLRISAPTIGGRNSESVDSARTLNALTESVLKNKPLNGIQLYQKILNNENIPRAEIVFNYAEAIPELYYPIWRNYINEDEESSKDKYRNFIEMLQSVSAYNNLIFQESSSLIPLNNSPTNFMNSNASVFSDFITRGDNFIIPFYDFINNEKRSGYIDFIVSPDGKEYCIPSTVLAVPSHADKISKEFLLFVLSDKIQSEVLGDGLPVNRISLERNIAEASEVYNVSLNNSVLFDVENLIPIADIDDLREETALFVEIFRSYSLGEITFEHAYGCYKNAGG